MLDRALRLLHEMHPEEADELRRYILALEALAAALLAEHLLNGPTTNA